MDEEKLLGMIICFNKRSDNTGYTQDGHEYSRDDVNFLKLYRDALSQIFSKSFGFYDSNLASKALDKIYTVGSMLTNSTGMKDMLRRSEECLNSVFYSR